MVNEVENKESIFYLPKSVDELPSSNSKIGDYHYELVRSLNNIQENSSSATDNKFGTQSSITYRWCWDSLSRWIPYLSYMEIYYELDKDAVGTQLTLNDDVAPSFGACSGMFTDIRYKIEQNEISRLEQNIPQIDSLDKRLNHSGGWMRELGSVSNFYQSSFYERQKQVVSEGYDVESRLDFQESNLTIQQLFPNIDIANDTIAWTSAGRLISFVDAAGANLDTILEVGDYIAVTFNNRRQIARITAMTGFGGGNGTITIDMDLGANVGAAAYNTASFNLVLFKRRPKLFKDNSVTTAQLFPNIDSVNDTVIWTRATKLLTFNDVAEVANSLLDTILKVGDYIKITLNTIGRIARITAKSSGWGISGGTKTMTLDVDFGANIGAIAYDTLVPNIQLWKELKTDYPRNLKVNKLVWQPPLSIFKCKKALPTCYNNELEFFIDSGNYKKSFIQSVLANRTDIDHNGTDYKLRILDMVFRPCKVIGGDRVVDDSFIIDLNEISCQKKPILNASGDEVSLEVKPSTMAIAIAFQDQSSGSNSLYPPQLFKIANNQELNLTSYYIRYAGRQRPSPNPVIDVTTANTDKIVDLYIRNNLSNCQFFADSQEKLNEWKERGIYFYHPWPKSGEDRDTYVQISSTFSSLSSSQINLLLFSFYKKMVLVEMENSKIKEIRIVNA